MAEVKDLWVLGCFLQRVHFPLPCVFHELVVNSWTNWKLCWDISMSETAPCGRGEPGAEGDPVWAVPSPTGCCLCGDRAGRADQEAPSTAPDMVRAWTQSRVCPGSTARSKRGQGQKPGWRLVSYGITGTGLRAEMGSWAQGQGGGARRWGWSGLLGATNAIRAIISCGL